VIPVPDPPVNATSDDLLGIWETYYYKKDIIYVPSTGEQQIFPGLRLVENDGYRTEFYRDSKDGRHKFKSYNVVGHVNDEGVYKANKDTIYFTFTFTEGAAKDTTTKQIIRRLDPAKGIFKTEDIYFGTIAGTGMKFEVYDMKAQRNIVTAPSYTDVPKIMLDSYFDELSKAPWDITGCAYYYNGNYLPEETKKMEDALLKTKTSYKFYTDAQKKRFCIISSLDPETNEMKDAPPCPLIIVDDVIYFFYTDPATGKARDFYMWVATWQPRNGVNTLIDRSNERYQNDISAIVTTEHNLTQRKN
jgi:hypothetical protein